MLQARIYISLKPDILDPAGKTIEHALASLQFRGLSGCRVGKYLELNFPDLNREEVEATVREMCRRLLVNPVMETYRLEIVEPE
jgi:phosphoribosylformylglycinamidine synthase